MGQSHAAILPLFFFEVIRWLCPRKKVPCNSYFYVTNNALFPDAYWWSPVVRHDWLLCFDNNVTWVGHCRAGDQIWALLGEEVNDEIGMLQ